MYFYSSFVVCVDLSHNIQGESIENGLKPLDIEINFTETSCLGPQENISIHIEIISEKKIIFLKNSICYVKD